MIKSDLIAQLAAKYPSLPESHVLLCVNEILKQMSDALNAGERIEIRGFGSFTPRHHQSRQARNPKTGEKLVIAAKQRPHFKAGKELKDKLLKLDEG